MMEYKLGEIEMKFADLIWDNEPITSGELAKRCEAALHWKKSTTYTILRRVCDRGLFRNDSGTVTSCVSKMEFLTKRSEQFVEDTFEGSLPRFLTAFTAGKRLSEREVAALKKIIEANSR